MNRFECPEGLEIIDSRKFDEWWESLSENNPRSEEEKQKLWSRSVDNLYNDELEAIIQAQEVTNGWDKDFIEKCKSELADRMIFGVDYEE